MGRSADILGRTLRRLKKYGVMDSGITDEEIYDELTQGQNAIISETRPSKSIKIKLTEGTEYYPLSTDENFERKNIAGVRAIVLPAEWRKDFKVTALSEFEKIRNACITKTGQPFIGAIYDNSMRVFPIPTAEYDQDEIELIVYLSSSTRAINKETEPELPEMWDKALELYAAAQFLTGNNKAELLAEYWNEVKRLRSTTHRTNFNLQRPSVL